jgi:signal transduction histidine kinase/CheY-like chemotaxis protein/ligand-binding sensor domain-containing protein/HPt (histidine-containing phosphotransfer) domain-containing protein
MYVSAPRHTALGRVFLRLLAGAALTLLAAAPVLATGISDVPGLPEGHPSFRFFGSEQGLPQNTPQSFALDARGFLWTGTQDGAAVYNGRFWKTVDMPNREESNSILDILAGADGSMWFATTIGLARLHNGRWTLFRKEAGLPSNRILSLAEERDGSKTVLWAGTDKGLAQWNGRAWTVLDARAAGLPNERIRSLLALQTDQGPVLWVGTGHGLARRQGGRWTTFPVGPAGTGPPEAEVTALLARREGGRSVLWAATNGGGLVRYDGERWSLEKGLPSDRVLSLSLLDSGTGDELWAGTSRGLAHRTGGTWSVYNTENAGLPSDQIVRLFASRSGGRPLLWIGMSTGGMAVLNPGGWRILDHLNSSLPRSWIYGLAESGPPDRPVYWFSAYDRGLARWEAGTWKVFSAGTPLEKDEVNLALPTAGPRGTTVWVGTSHGLFRWEGGRWAGAGEILSGLPASEVLSLLESRTPAGPVLWVGTRDGLASCAAGRCQVFTPENSALPDRQIYTLLETREAEGPVLWIGTRDGGLVRWSSGKQAIYNTRTSPLRNNWINDLRETRSGGRRFLWIGTNGGAVRLDLSAGEPHWLVLDEKSRQARLPSNVIYQILEDARGRIYLASNRGMVRLTPRPGDPNAYDVYTFTIRDGLAFNECNQSSSLIDRAGRLWVGTNNAVSWLDPSVPEPKLGPSPLYVERITVDGRELAPAGAPLRLGERPAEVAFEYVLLSYFRETDTRYRVQLVGWQDTPSDWISDPVQRYSHLTPGSYRFRVWGRDAAGVVSGPVEVSFVIPLSPWRSGWAYLLYIAAAALLVGGGVRWRTAALQRRARRLEDLVRERTESLALSEAESRERARRLAETVDELERSEKEAHTAKDEADRANRFKSQFLANMSHEIRTPMNAVIGMTSILAGSRLTPEQRDYVGTIRSSGESLLALLNDILDFSKIEAGKLVIEASPFALQQCVKEAADLLAVQAARKGLEIGCLIDPAVPALIESDATRLRQILVNLLDNAVKFTPSGEILIRVDACSPPPPELSPGELVELRFAVRDTGIGISPDRMDRLFRPFSQADSSTNRLYGGTGLGLAICHRLAQGLGGRIWVESAPNEGSTFWFTIRCRVVDTALPPGFGKAPPGVSRESEGAGRIAGSELPPLRILVAEDNVVNQKVALLLLQQLGYAADVAADGEETLAALRRQRYDVILMDVQMPGMDGLEATRRIRDEWPIEGRPRIIAVTANALREDRETCLAAGMDDYLSKPVLLEDLRVALSRGMGSAVPALSFAAGAAASAGGGEESFDPKYIDQLRQLQAIAGKELVSPIIDRFLAEAPRRLAELRRTLAARDDHNFVFVAHSFKASSAQLGARRLAEICQDLEMRGRRMEWSGMEEILCHLQSEIENIAPLLRAQAAEGLAPQVPAREP